MCGSLCGISCPHLCLEIRAFVTRKFKFDLKAQSSSAILVRWAEPSGDYQGHYRIRYRQSGKQRFHKVDVPNAHSHQITGLVPDEEYEVGIEDKSLPVDQQKYSRSKFITTFPAHSGSGERRRLLHPEA